MTQQRFAALQWLVIALLFAWALYALAPVVTPFAIAAIMAYICNPWVDRLCAMRLPGQRAFPRTLAALLVMLGLLSLLLLLLLIVLPLLAHEGNLLITRLPDFLETVRLKLLPSLQQFFGVMPQWDMATLKSLLLNNTQGAAAKVLPWLGSGGSALLEFAMNIFLIPLALFYLLRDWPLLLARVAHLIPRPRLGLALEIARETDAVLAEFLRGQLGVMALMSLYYVVVLWLSGLQFALPIGLLAGMLVFVPYLGMAVGLTLATLAALTQFGEPGGILVVWAVFGVGQLLEGMLVTPRLVGDRIGLHPLAVVFALLAFGQLFGFTGVLFALPLSAVLLVCLRHVLRSYLASPLYRE